MAWRIAGQYMETCNCLFPRPRNGHFAPFTWAD